MFKLRKKKEEAPSIICVGCEERMPLWYEMEQCFASAEIQQRGRDVQEESAIELSKKQKRSIDTSPSIPLPVRGGEGSR